MNKSRSFLTIAIPTFNRAESLRRSLGAMIRQIDEIADGWNLIDVLVSDNCSTDSTGSVVAEFAQRYPISYFRNDVNLGMEGNFLACFERAGAPLVWTFSDDDILVDGALRRILDLAMSKPVDLIYVRPKFQLGELDTFSTDAVEFQLDRVTREYFALRANGLLSFLSAVVVNKDRYLAIRNGSNLRRYAGTWLAHYEWIYTLLDAGNDFYVANRPIIRARTGATGGYDIFKVFGEHYVAIGKEKLAGRPQMRSDLEHAMLYMHIPGFIDRCRVNRFGRFEYVPDRIDRQILDAYGSSVFTRLIVRNQLFGGERTATAAYRISQVIARLWLAYRRLFCRKREI
jgi:abequosyltransferase